MTKPPARPYQEAGTRWLIDKGRGLLGDEAGLGKSRQLLEAATGNTLVIAPAMVLDGGNWDDETAKWADVPVTQAAYTSLNQREKTGRGTATRPVERLREEFDAAWDTVILDEAHYVKGRKTSWTWAVKEISKRSGRFYLATGTPIPNWASELFVPLQLIYPEQAVRGGRLGSFWRWAGEWFDTSPTRFSKGMPVVGELKGCMTGGRFKDCLTRPPTDPCEHYHEFVQANLGDRFLQRFRDDVLTDLPPMTEQVIETPMTPEQAKAYRKLKKEYLAQYETEEGEGELVAWTPAAKNVILDRLTTALGVAIPDAKNGLRHSGKLQRLAFDLEARAHPTLVMAHYRDTVEACVEVAKGIGAKAAMVHGGSSQSERSKAVRAFQEGRVDVLVGSLETLAEGLTLTAADLLIFVEKSYKPHRNEQARRRVHRLGQTRPVTIYDYVTPNSVDANKRELLATKTDRQMRFLTAAQFARLL